MLNTTTMSIGRPQKEVMGTDSFICAICAVENPAHICAVSEYQEPLQDQLSHLPEFTQSASKSLDILRIDASGFIGAFLRTGSGCCCIAEVRWIPAFTSDKSRFT